MIIETLNLGDHVSARLIDGDIVTGNITHITIKAYKPTTEGYDDVLQISTTEGYDDVLQIYYTLSDSGKRFVVREYEIINNESK